jgi:uncharacterized membrane-anchored protein
MYYRNLPHINNYYWITIFVASVCGANTGDYVSHNLHLGHIDGLLPLSVILALIFYIEKLCRFITVAYYWLAIIVLRTAATNIADLITHDFRINYIYFIILITIFMIVIILFDQWRSNKLHFLPTTKSIIKFPKTNFFYWLIMLLAGILGTTLGDYVADELGIGVVYGSIELVSLLILVIWLIGRYATRTIFLYWLVIVTARTAGTVVGDCIASKHGLNLGLPLSTTVTTVIFILLIFLFTFNKKNHNEVL